MDDLTQKELRERKRIIKRLGHKHRRRKLKQELAEKPEEASSCEFEPDFGRYRSAELNGLLDRDRTKHRKHEIKPDVDQA